MNQEVFAAVADALDRGEPAALVTIVSATGSTPQRVGAKMLVFGDGRIVGTIGGGCYENDAFWKAREAITSRKPQLVHYELDDDFAQETGLICGGQMDVYIEPIEPSPELYIVGAGHVGFHLARVAHEVGFRVHVVDDREKFANRERFPDAVEVVVEDIPAWIARRQPAGARVRGDRHARPHERPRSAARAGAARAAVSRPHRQPRQSRAHLRTARRRQDAAGAAQARPRAHRPRHRRGHAAGNRGQHPGRAHRREARQDGQPRRGRALDEVGSTSHVAAEAQKTRRNNLSNSAISAPLRPRTCLHSSFAADSSSP